MIDFAKSLSTHLMNVCDCYYSSNFITSGQFLCYNSDKLVYQGRILATDGTSAEEIRNLTQIWVLKSPVVKIGATDLQVDPSCPVTLISIGDPYCDMDDSAVSTNEGQNSQLSKSAGVGIISTIIVLLVMVFATLSVIVLYWFVCRKHKDSFRQSILTNRYAEHIPWVVITDSAVDLNSIWCSRRNLVTLERKVVFLLPSCLIKLTMII